MRAIALSALALGVVAFAPTVASADDTQEAVNASIRQVQIETVRGSVAAPRLIEGRNVATSARNFRSVDELLNKLNARSNG